MRKWIGYLATVLIGLMAGAGMERYGSQTSSHSEIRIERDSICIRDTVVVRDPEGKGTAFLGYREVTLNDSGATLIKLGEDNGGDENMEEPLTPVASRGDSVRVRLRVEQREYEGEDYRAWVSGVDARLDSIWVFPKREMVRVRERVGNHADPLNRQGEKRWHIGPMAGVGWSPGVGVQPYLGIGVTYSIFSF